MESNRELERKVAEFQLMTKGRNSPWVPEKQRVFKVRLLIISQNLDVGKIKTASRNSQPDSAQNSAVRRTNKGAPGT